MGWSVPPRPPEWLVHKQRMTQIIHETLKGGVHFFNEPENAAELVARFAERLIAEIDASTDRKRRY